MGSAESLKNEDLERAYVLLRITLGLNILMHGIVRWAGGLGGFAESLVTMFQKIPLPMWSVYSFGVVLPVLESLVGLSVLIGFQTRRALMSGMAIMLALIFGSTLHQDWQIAGLQLIYSFVYAALLAGVRFDTYCVDRLFPKNPKSVVTFAAFACPMRTPLRSVSLCKHQSFTSPHL